MITTVEAAFRRIGTGVGATAAANAARMLRAVADSRSVRRQVAQLAGLLDELDVGLVSVDSATDFAHVNASAAELLKVRAGHTTATEFTDIMRRLAGETLNHADTRAALRQLELDPTAQLRTTWLFSQSPTHLGVLCKPARYPGFTGRIWAFYDNSPLARAMAASDRANALWRANTESMLDPQVLMEGIWQDGHVVDLVHRDVNRAACEYLGLSRDQLLGRSVLETMPDIAQTLPEFLRCAETGAPVILDDVALNIRNLGEVRYYDTRASQPLTGWITVTWRDVTDRSELTRRIAASEEQFRLLAENVADVVCRLADDSTITWVSKSVETALGAPPEFWVGRCALDFSLPVRRTAARRRWDAATHDETAIGRARILDRDGKPHWLHFHIKPYYDADGRRDGMVASFRVIDEEVAAEEKAQRYIADRDRRNQALATLLQEQTDRLMSDIKSAANYVASILPGDLDGEVPVTSRYVSTRELGGDSYDYRWIDDDHLIVYLLDVSGHGVEPAMVSVSAHNLIRSGTLSTATMREPGLVLTELNRLFQMEQQGGNYFTIWYGVYQASTRTLRYASAGHPPALVWSGRPGALTVDELATAAVPVGMFDDTTFESGSYVVPPDAEMLIYSDGAFELTLADGTLWSLPDFIEMCRGMAGTPQWSLDALISRLKAVATSGSFEDDCTLVQLSLP